MILSQRTMRGNFFARNSLADLLPLSDHNALLAGDVLTTVTLNYEWRVFVVSIVEKLLETNRYELSETEFSTLDIVYLALLEDFYN